MNEIIKDLKIVQNELRLEKPNKDLIEIIIAECIAGIKWEMKERANNVR